MADIRSSQIGEILVISLSNIGDVILTFPVIDVLREDFHNANLSIIIGAKALPLVQGNPIYKSVFVYNKRASFINQFLWLWDLKKTRYDLIVDLRNTAIPLFLWPRFRTSLFKTKDKGIHMKEKHLNRLSQVYPFSKKRMKPQSLYVSPEEIQNLKDFLGNEPISCDPKRYVVIAPGAANEDKRWNVEGYAAVCAFLKERYGFEIVFVGDANDRKIGTAIAEKLSFPTINGCGKISLTQLSFLMQESCLVVSNDSSPMHLASYLNIPVVAVFGPSDPVKYGPWSCQRGAYIKKRSVCKRCINPKEIHEPHTCIDVDEKTVIQEIENILQDGEK